MCIRDRYIPEEDAFTCAKGRKLKYAFTRKAEKKQDLYLSERYIFVSLVTDADTKKNANGM